MVVAPGTGCPSDLTGNLMVLISASGLRGETVNRQESRPSMCGCVLGSILNPIWWYGVAQLPIKSGPDNTSEEYTLTEPGDFVSQVHDAW